MAERAVTLFNGNGVEIGMKVVVLLMQLVTSIVAGWLLLPPLPAEETIIFLTTTAASSIRFSCWETVVETVPLLLS